MHTDDLAVVLVHGVEEVEGTAEVVAVVEEGLGNRLTDALEGAEVDDGVEGTVLAEEVLNILEVEEIALGIARRRRAIRRRAGGGPHRHRRAS